MLFRSSLLQLSDATKQIDAASLNLYLAYQYVPHPHSILRGYHKLPPGHWAIYERDQLRIERETLQNELYNMLADGTISEEEHEIIQAEAKRLHLSQEEVDRLIDKAHRQREQTSNHALMSMPQLIAQPAAAVERYRELLSQIRQLSQLCDASQMSRIIEDPERANGLERNIWRQVMAQADSDRSRPEGQS